MDFDNNQNENNEEWRAAGPKSNKPRNSRQNNVSNDQTLTSISKTIVNTSYNKHHVNKIKSLNEKSVRCLVILRGCSGSGKSTLAREIEFEGVIASADSYFIQNGTYKYEPSKINEAHKYSKLTAEEAAKAGISPIIIDNTNIRIWEFKDYVKIALKYEYHIEIMEPATPWARNANKLSEKNVHDVPFNKIKSTLNDFEKVNLNSLIETCRKELEEKKSNTTNIPLQKANHIHQSESEPINSSTSKTKSNNEPKFISNFNEYFNSSNPDWSQFGMDDSSSQNESKTSPTISSSNTMSLFNNNKHEKKTLLELNLNEKKDDSKIGKEIEQSRKELSLLFPHVKDDIIIDFLLKYENDVDMVSNILLDSIDIDLDSNEEKINTAVEKEIRHVPSLKQLCENAMSQLEFLIESHYEKDDKYYHLPKTTKSENPIKSQSENDLDIYKSENNSGYESDSSRSISEDDYFPIMELKLNKKIIRSLIDLFGDKEDEKYLNDDQVSVHLDLKMAEKIYSSWKKTMIENRKMNGSNDDKQIQCDEKLSRQLFDEMNMRDPIEKIPVYISEKSNYQASMRQIMAEQEFEEKLEKNGSSFFNRNNNNNNNNNSPMQLQMNPIINDGKNMANILKAKRLHEKYDKLVDTQMVDKLFKDVNYNFDDACQLINTIYDLDHIKEPEKNYFIKSNKSNGYMEQNINGISYYDSNWSNNNYIYNENSQDDNMNRKMAAKFSKIRHECAKKANEAFKKVKRNWGAVAQYYSEEGRKYQRKMQEFNKAASYEIFQSNNSDIKNSNILDLHGLHVNEALEVFKEIYYKKKNELSTSSNKNLKTFLMVITGYGHHSENGPKLRPNIINYLNRSKIRYKEPYTGHLKVDLMNLS